VNAWYQKTEKSGKMLMFSLTQGLQLQLTLVTELL